MWSSKFQMPLLLLTVAVLTSLQEGVSCQRRKKVELDLRDPRCNNKTTDVTRLNQLKQTLLKLDFSKRFTMQIHFNLHTAKVNKFIHLVSIIF